MYTTFFERLKELVGKNEAKLIVDVVEDAKIYIKAAENPTPRVIPSLNIPQALIDTVGYENGKIYVEAARNPPPRVTHPVRVSENLVIGLYLSNSRSSPQYYVEGRLIQQTLRRD